MSRAKPVLADIQKKAGIQISKFLKPNDDLDYNNNNTSTQYFLTEEGAKLIDTIRKEEENYKKEIEKLYDNINELEVFYYYLE